MFNARTLVSVVRRGEVFPEVKTISLFIAAFLDIAQGNTDGRNRFFQVIVKARADSKLSGELVEFLFSFVDVDAFTVGRMRDGISSFIVV